MRKLLIAGLFGLFGAGVASAQYTFVDLHPGPGDSTSATSIYNSLISGNFEFWDGMAGGMAWNANTGTEYFNSTISEAFATNGTLVGGVIGNFGGIWNPVSNTTTLFSANSRVLGMFGNEQVGRDPAGAKMWHGTAASMVALPSLVGLVATQANATDGTYQVGFGGFVSTGYTPHAMLWQGAIGIPVDLHPSAFRSSKALGVSNGYQVGYAESQFGAPYYGYEIAMMWSGTAASAVSLHPSGCTYSYANGVSGNQQVGWAHFALTGANHALLWNGSANNYLDLHTFLPPGYVNSYANSIDPVTGDIVGVVETSDGYTHAALWRRTTPSNQPPVISPIGNQSVDELTELTIDVDATDPDPVLALTYSLTQFPAGMGIDSATGLITWTPTEAQGPGDYPVTVVVDDNVGETDTESFTIHVNEVNSAPVWSTIPDVTLGENVALSSELGSVASFASDADEPSNSLSFSLVSGPSGLTVALDGQIEWTTTESDGGTNPVVTIRVTDDGSPALSADQQFTIHVIEGNEPPEIAPIPDMTVDELSLATFTAVGSDPDLPAQALTYSISSAPAGASINPTTGVFTWTPSESDGPMDAVFDVSVSDGSLSATQTVHIHVNEVNTPPQFTNFPTIIEADVDTSVAIGLFADDIDLPNQVLTFSLINGPPGFSINPDGTANYWVGASLAGQDWPITVAVSDGIDSTQGTFILRVHTPPNNPPVLQPIADQSVWEDMLCTFTALGSDPDAGQTVTYSLEGTIPFGAYIAPSTGVFTFRPTAVQSAQNYQFDIVVTDSASPPLSTRQTITLEAKRENRTANAVWGWGYNSYGQLAIGTTQYANPITLIPALFGYSQIFANSSFSFGRSPQLSWKSWGENGYGQAGIGTTSSGVLTPTSVPALQGHVDIGGGFSHALSLDASGHLFSWGQNANGQLAQNSFLNTSVPAVVPGSNVFSAVSGRFGRSTYAISPPSNGGPATLLVAGANDSFQLGLGWSNGNFPSLNPLALGQNVVVSVRPTDEACTFLTDDGRVLALGRVAGQGQAILPITDMGLTDVVQITTGAHTSYALRRDGTVWAWGNNYAGQCGIGNQDYSVALPTRVGQLMGVTQISGGDNSCYALKSDGTVWAWGGNWSNQIGIGFGANVLSPVQVPSISGIERITSYGPGCFAWRYGPLNQPPVLAPIGNRSFDELTAGVITPSASDPDSGQTLTYSVAGAPSGMTINPNTGVVNWTPTEAQGPWTYTVTITVTDNGTPAASDSETFDIIVNEVNQAPTLAAIPNQTVNELDNLTFTAVGADADLPAQSLTYSIISAPAGATINSSTGVFNWTPTSNQGGQTYAVTVRATDSGSTALFVETLVNISVVNLNRPPTLSWPQNHRVQTGTALALDIDSTDPDLPNDLLTYSLENGPVGATIDAQTGQFSWTPAKDGTTIIQVKVTDNAGLSDKKLFSVSSGSLGTVGMSWGANYAGQLGDGTTTPRFAPTPVMGLSNLVSVAGGSYHGLALLIDGTVRTWGNNQHGQLGDGTTVQRVTPTLVSGLTNVVAVAGGLQHSLALLSDGTVRAWGQNNAGQLGDGTATDRLTPTSPSSLNGVVSIACGAYYSLALMNDGTVRAWGYNDYGQLGDGTTSGRLIPTPVWGLTNVISVACGDSHTLAVLGDGTARAWGYNGFGQLGDGTTINRVSPIAVSGLTNVTSVAGGHLHSLALLSDGTVRAWGNNPYGQLGDGTTTDSLTPIPVSGLNNVITLGSGFTHSLALLNDGTTRAWGDNSWGKLGDGTWNRRLIPTQVFGLTNTVSVSGGREYSLAVVKVVPTANAGSDVSIPVPHDGLPATNTATVTLSGAGTLNPNNDTFTYEWKEGTAVVGSGVSLTVTRPAGTYTFTLCVTGSNGLTGTDDVTVTVTPEQNQAPVATAGPDQSVAVPHDGNPATNTASIHLASLSTDPESDPLSLEWWEGTNQLGTVAGLNVQRPAGTYTFTLKATDSYGAQSSDTVVVTVTPEQNQAPVANAGPDKTYAVPHDGNPLTNLATFTLSGSGSDPDSDPLGYAWTQGASGVGNSASVTIQRPAGGYSFLLTVSDPYGASGTDSVNITITPEPNKPPKAIADQFTVKKNTTTMLHVLKNDTDGDGDPLTLVSVSGFGVNVAVVSNQVRFIPATNFLGTVSFTYTMRDPYGVTSSANVSVKVSNAGASGYTP